MADDMREQSFPALHVQVERSTQRFYVHAADGIEAVPARLTEPRDPFGVEFLDAERAVTFRPRLDGQQLQNLLEPACDPSSVERLDVHREYTAVRGEVVVQAIDSGI